MVVMVPAQPQVRGNLGGGFIEYLFGDTRRQDFAPPPHFYADPGQGRQYANTEPMADPMLEPPGPPIDPQFLRQEVVYQGTEAPGTIVIDTPNHFLYLVGTDGRALRYGIGARPSRLHLVGRPYRHHQEGVAGLGAAAGDAATSTRTAALHGGRPRTIRSARVRCISARRSTASTARTSPGP